MLRLRILPIIAALSISVAASAQHMHIMAGSPLGSSGFAGDGGQARSALLSMAYCATPDRNGNVFIADAANGRIRKVSPSGTITTVAGNGDTTHHGDGGPATAAGIQAAIGVAVDKNGALYIAEYTSIYGSYIRKVSAAGVITTIAGNGTTTTGGDGGPGTATGLNYVTDVAVDTAGNVYAVDNYDYRVRKISPAGIITTIAGAGPGIGTSGDGIPATAVNLYNPKGIALDGSGNVYIGHGAHIRKINSAGIISTVAGSATGIGSYSGDGGPATAAELIVDGLSRDTAGNMYFTDWDNHVVRKINSAGIISTVAGTGVMGSGIEGEDASSWALMQPNTAAMDKDGNMIIADHSYVLRISANSTGLKNDASAAKSDIQAWPSPNNGNFTIVLPGTSAARIVISDIIGRQVMALTTTTGRADVHMTSPAGIYIVTATGSNGTQTAKVIVQ